MDIVFVQPALDEVKKVFDLLVDYYASLASFLEDPSNNPPSFSEDVTPNLTSADTLGVAVSTKDLSSNRASGYLVDAAGVLAAVSREASIRAKPKSSYYFDAQYETETESSVYLNLNAEYRAGILGNIN